MDRAHHREVLECHLGWSVLADRHAGVRAREADVRPRDRGHADEVVGPGEERRERRSERHEPHDLHADRGGDHLLLGDVHLEETVRGGLLEVFGVGGIGDLRVEHHDVAARRAERGERLAVRLARREGLGVALERDRARARGRPGHPALGLRDRERAVRALAELRERLTLLVGVERLPMPAFLVLEEGHASAFQRARDDRRRPLRAARASEGIVDLGEVVAVDDERVHPEGAHAGRVGVEIPSELRRATLPEPVDVEDRDEVRKALVAGVVESFPDRALRGLAVPTEDPHAIGRVERTLSGEGDPDADRQALTERARRDVDPREHRRGMTLEAASKLPEGHELVVRYRAGRFEHRVDEGRRVTLREDEVVVRGVLGMGEVVAQMPGEKDRDEIRRRERRRRMARSGGG